MKRIVLGVCIALAAAILTSPVLAQDTGAITGTVRDNTGAVVPNADVQVSSVGGTLRLATLSNSAGEYLVPGLPGGTYDLSISASGFKVFDAKGIVLRVAQKARVDATLAVGSVNQSLTVQGEGLAQVDTQSSEVAGTLTGTQISKLQMNGRVFTSLIGLQPGVTDPTEGDEITGAGVSASINGGRSEYTDWQVNGGGNQDNGANSQLVVLPSVDAISEVRVLESSYGAQYGKNGAGAILIDTKSGTSAFHGDLYYYGRNDYLNARDFFADPTNPKKPPYKKHDWGYTFGGPVYLPSHYNSDKSKTFFFWSQEWRRQKAPNPILVKVPSDAERGGDFSDVCPGVSCPSGGPLVTIDPNSLILLQLIPRSNLSVNGAPFFSTNISIPATTREELLKIDHNLTSKARLMFSYIHDSGDQLCAGTGFCVGDDTFGRFTSDFHIPGTSMVARLTHQISPTLFNEFTTSYSSNWLNLTDHGPWQRSLYPGLFSNTLFANNFSNNGSSQFAKVTGFSVSDSNIPLGFNVNPSVDPWINSNPTYSYRDNVSKIAGKHSLQFGAYFQAAQKNEDAGGQTEGLLSFSNFSAVTTGNAFADFLTGNIRSFSQDKLQLKYYQRYKILEPYLQDDWRIAPRLTLNLGLRVSLFGTYRERYKQASSFDPAAFNPAVAPLIDQSTGALIQNASGNANPFNGLVQCGGPGGPVALPGNQFPNAAASPNRYPGCMKGHLFNPAPRVGFAFDPRGNGKMVIRAGYGIFYEHTNGNEANTNGAEGNPPQFLNATQSNITGYSNIGGSGAALFPMSPISIPDKVVWPYMQQWHLDFQKEIPGKTVLMVAYVGSKGTHLTTSPDTNQLQRVPAAENPFGPGQTLTSTNACANAPYSAGQTVTGTTGPGSASLSAHAAQNLNVACGVNPTVAGYVPFAGYNGISALREESSSNYNSLQVSARRTVGGLTYSLAYTYSHSIDDTSGRFEFPTVGGFGNTVLDSYNRSAFRASSNFDQRHILNMSYDYKLPIFRVAGWTHTFLGGWEVSGITLVQSGMPFVMLFGTDNAGVSNSNALGSFLDVVGDPHAPPATKTAGGRPVLFNPAAFSEPQGLTFGNSGRNRFTLPRRINFDMGLFKNFPVREGKSFEFRLEGFNISNHPQFNSVDTTMGDPLFMTPSSGHAARIMQYSLKFIF